MDYEPMNQSYGAGAYGQQTLGSYVAKTYLWMFAGLMLTFGIAMGGYATGAVFYVFEIPYMLFILTGLELLTVIVMSARANKISVGAARGMFLFYSALNGVVFSAYFLIFGVVGMVLVFAATSVFFGVMAAVSMIFKLDISGISFLLSGNRRFPGLHGVRYIQDPRKLHDLFRKSGASRKSRGFLRAGAVSGFHQSVPLHPAPSEQEP